MKSIKEHAFSASPYPVIITLEDHLTPELQAKVAQVKFQIILRVSPMSLKPLSLWPYFLMIAFCFPQMLTQTFGEMLFYPKSECLEEFPSPEQLKYRIIISTKPPKEYLENKSFADDENISQKRKDPNEDIWGKEPSDLTTYQANDYKVSMASNLATCWLWPNI